MYGDRSGNFNMGAKEIEIAMTTSNTIRPATVEDTQQLVDIVTEAFLEDPVFNWFVRTDAQRNTAIRSVMENSAESYLPKGACEIEENGKGATLWLPPAPHKEKTDSLVRELRMLPRYAQVSGWRRLRRLIHIAGLTAKKHPTSPHYYLFVIGVRNKFKGQGVGSSLLRSVLDRCDTEGVPAYLENSNERNLPLYLRHGFEIMEELELPWEGPRMWLMWRKPA